MKSNAKKLLSLMFIICISTILGLSGCGKDKAESIQTDNTSVEDVTPAPGTEETASEDVIEVVTANSETEEEEAPIPEEKSSLSLTFSKESGVYEGEFDLEITCEGASEIYYTTDGSNPITSKTRTQYSAPIKVADRSKEPNYVSAVDPFLYDAANVKLNSDRDGFRYTLGGAPSAEVVDKCTVVRAVALDKEGLYTEVTTDTYFVGNMTDHIQGIKESCEAAGMDLAIISISIDYDDMFDPDKGIYVKGNLFEEALKQYLSSGGEMKNDVSRRLAANYNQKGREWERSIHMDFFESDGTATTLGLSQDCGIRIQGNYSRSDLHKGFRLYARSEYGEKNFEYPVFGDSLKNDVGETITKFKTLTLRNGGNCAFTTKYSDTYWQSLVGNLDCDTQTSRPCIVYIDGEYWGLYVLQEDYSQDYFEYAHGVNKDDVVLYKGDAEVLEIGYKLDLGELPEGETDESYYFKELMDFFRTHKDLSNDTDYEEFSKLVDIESARDYFAVQVWINNKWDWPGKNWSLWRTVNVEDSNPYGDGRWRYIFYDIEFGGVNGASDARTNTIKEDNYKPLGLLDKDTENPAVLIYVYLMTNAGFREDYANSLLALSDNQLKQETALARLDQFNHTYSPLYDQFFARYEGAGSTDNSINGGYASYACIKDFLELREDNIQPMLDYVNKVYP